MNASSRGRILSLRAAVTLSLTLSALAGAAGCSNRVDWYGPIDEGNEDLQRSEHDPEGADPDRPHLEIVADPSIDSSHTFAVRLWNAGHRNGIHGAWCVDRRTISASGPYPVDLFSDEATLPPHTLAAAERLELVNYVVNTFTAGATIELPTPEGEEAWSSVLSVDDIQEALWALVEGATSGAQAAPGSPTVSAMIQTALVDGPGFVPQCGDRLALVAVPRTYVDPVEGNESQILAVVLPFSAGDCP